MGKLVEEFEAEWKKVPPEASGNGYSRKFVEFCSAKALTVVCQNIQEKITDGSFTRFTFDMMLAWEKPSYSDDEPSMVRRSPINDSLYSSNNHSSILLKFVQNIYIKKMRIIAKTKERRKVMKRSSL